jgi:hypothetical protein
MCDCSDTHHISPWARTIRDLTFLLPLLLVVFASFSNFGVANRIRREIHKRESNVAKIIAQMEKSQKTLPDDDVWKETKAKEAKKEEILVTPSEGTPKNVGSWMTMQESIEQGDSSSTPRVEQQRPFAEQLREVDLLKARLAELKATRQSKKALKTETAAVVSKWQQTSVEHDTHGLKKDLPRARFDIGYSIWDGDYDVGEAKTTKPSLSGRIKISDFMNDNETSSGITIQEDTSTPINKLSMKEQRTTFGPVKHHHAPLGPRTPRPTALKDSVIGSPYKSTQHSLGAQKLASRTQARNTSLKTESSDVDPVGNYLQISPFEKNFGFNKVQMNNYANIGAEPMKTPKQPAHSIPVHPAPKPAKQPPTKIQDSIFTKGKPNSTERNHVMVKSSEMPFIRRRKLNAIKTDIMDGLNPHDKSVGTTGLYDLSKPACPPSAASDPLFKPYTTLSSAESQNNSCDDKRSRCYCWGWDGFRCTAKTWCPAEWEESKKISSPPTQEKKQTEPCMYSGPYLPDEDFGIDLESGLTNSLQNKTPTQPTQKKPIEPSMYSGPYLPNKDLPNGDFDDDLERGLTNSYFDFRAKLTYTESELAKMMKQQQDFEEVLPSVRNVFSDSKKLSPKETEVGGVVSPHSQACEKESIQKWPEQNKTTSEKDLKDHFMLGSFFDKDEKSTKKKEVNRAASPSPQEREKESTLELLEQKKAASEEDWDMVDSESDLSESESDFGSMPDLIDPESGAVYVKDFSDVRSPTSLDKGLPEKVKAQPKKDIALPPSRGIGHARFDKFVRFREGINSQEPGIDSDSIPELAEPQPKSERINDSGDVESSIKGLSEKVKAAEAKLEKNSASLIERGKVLSGYCDELVRLQERTNSLERFDPTTGEKRAEVEPISNIGPSTTSHK